MIGADGRLYVNESYAGTVTSFTRISANLGAIVGPIIVAMVTKEVNNNY